jgi:hypothetical protein
MIWQQKAAILKRDLRARGKAERLLVKLAAPTGLRNRLLPKPFIPGPSNRWWPTAAGRQTTVKAVSRRRAAFTVVYRPATIEAEV